MVKELALQTIQELPENVNIKELIEAIYLKYKAMEGIEAARKGEVISHEELKKEIESW